MTPDTRQIERDVTQIALRAGRIVAALQATEQTPAKRAFQSAVTRFGKGLFVEWEKWVQSQSEEPKKA